jgi:aspartyl-tRNA(Asn)/glutamyl-tRNA(Gln) amidotransferase subunit B
MYEPVIGLEVHIQLNTKSKLFSGAETKFGQAPNTQACAVDLAMPGVLPVLNKEAVLQAIKFGLATQATINKTNFFARKNYFYPDLPKGYQTSQSDYPIISDGHLSFDVEGIKKTVHIVRAHLEEDAGKSIHDLLQDQSAIDLNRAGCALLEIVTAPELYSAEEVQGYLKTLHRLVRHLDICDGNMQEGSFRVDVNVSLRPVGTVTLGTRCEIKNINSFKFIDKALEYEMSRQAALLQAGEKVIQQTRLFQESTGKTIAMRDKEDAQDYRYFPCPDLFPVRITQETINEIKAQIPPLPEELLETLTQEHGLSKYDALILIDNPAMLNLLIKSLSYQKVKSAKAAANLLLSDISGYANKHQISFENLSLRAEDLALLTDRIHDKTLSSKTVKQLIIILLEGAVDVDKLIEQHGLKQVNNLEALTQAVHEVLEQFPEQRAELKSGKDKLVGFFVGQVMKKMKGTGNPEEIQRLLLELC